MATSKQQAALYKEGRLKLAIQAFKNGLFQSYRAPPYTYRRRVSYRMDPINRLTRYATKGNNRTANGRSFNFIAQEISLRRQDLGTKLYWPL